LKRLDVLILKEILPTWAFGVALFSAMIMAGQFLFELTRLMSQGVPFGQVVSLALLLTPGVMSKTFSMAMLLSTLLSFGRLSGDSEIVAIRAAGVNVARIMRGVAGFGACVAVITFFFGNWIVPDASLRAFQLRFEIEKALEGKGGRPLTHIIAREGRTVAFLNAQNFSIEQQLLSGVVINYLDNKGQLEYIMTADRMRYQSEDDWDIEGTATLKPWNGTRTLIADHIWPQQVEKLDFKPEDLIANNLKDMDAFSMDQLQEQMRKELEKPRPDMGKVSNFEFGYWNKLSLPFSALVFGLVGAPLGIRNHRSGKATGFWLSIVIIFAYMMLTNIMSIMAREGLFSAAVASFTPVVIGIIFGIVLIRTRN
jgi:lipopolysaccharide export system permease protein